MKVYLIGVGMGNVDTLTIAAVRAIEESDLIIGAKRLLKPFDDLECEKMPLVRSDDIVAALENTDAAQVSILMSGDVGFYSGAAGLYGKLALHDLEVIPGVSSLVYFCARLRTPWQDVALVSAHGREHDAVGTVQSHARTFCITGGQTRVEDICRDLVARGLGRLRVAAGERLSYEGERIVEGRAEELAKMEFANLAVLLVENPHPVASAYSAPALPDDAFERGAAPMTKAEVRALVIAKMRIAAGHTVWDVGAGSGSVSVEAALAARKGCVFSVEKRPEAVELLERAKAGHGVMNMHVVAGEAPTALKGLPAPDRVFVGGSSGNMDGIFASVLRANPQARLCATAVTLETLSELLACLAKHGLEDADIVQVSISRAAAAGPYHLMRAENPVYIVTAERGEQAR